MWKSQLVTDVGIRSLPVIVDLFRLLGQRMQRRHESGYNFADD